MPIDKLEILMRLKAELQGDRETHLTFLRLVTCDDVSSEFLVCSLLHGEEATDNYQDTQRRVPVSPRQTGL